VEWNEYTCLLAYLLACLLVDYRPPLCVVLFLFLLLLWIGFVFWATIRNSSIQVTVVRSNRIKPALGRSIVYVSLLTLSSLILILMPSCLLHLELKFIPTACRRCPFRTDTTNSNCINDPVCTTKGTMERWIIFLFSIRIESSRPLQRSTMSPITIGPNFITHEHDLVDFTIPPHGQR
jgi:RNA polymerase subunit RPABC4/transcription elongation factor Spt4